MTTNEICLQPHEFDKSRLVICEPTTVEIGKGEKKTPYTSSDIYYKNDDGDLCKLYFLAPTQDVWGFNKMYPFGTSKKEQDDKTNLKGFQVAYPLTSLTTMKAPTKEEKDTKAFFDAVFDATVETLKKECAKYKKEKDPTKKPIPRTTYSAFSAAGDEGDVRKAVKKIYDYPNKKDSKEKNKEKPLRMYVKLITKGKGEEIICDTKIYGPKDKRMSARSLVGQRGKMTPLFLLESLYWGQHGVDSPYGVSARFFLDQCNFTPLGSSRGSSRRYLPSNTDEPIVEDDEDSSFHLPTGDAEEEEEEDFTESNEPPFKETNDLEDEEEPQVKVKAKKPRAKKINKRRK